MNFETNNSNLNEFQQETQEMIKEYEINNPTIKLDEYLKLCATNLKKLILISTRFQIEAIRYEHTKEYSYNLENKINEQKLQFFFTIIGFIDGIIESDKKNKKVNRNYSIRESQNKQTLLQTTRNKIITNFEDLLTEKEPTLLLGILTTIPAYEGFSELYKYFSKNDCSPSLPISLINSYNIGYKNSQYDIKEIFKLYQQLYYEIINFMESFNLILEGEKLNSKKI